jgi:hypothetical protein
MTGEWNDATKTQLAVLWEQGHPLSEIGRRLGFTRNAIAGKVHRLGLLKRPSPITRDPNGTPGWKQRPRPIVPANTLPPLPSLSLPLPVFHEPPRRRPEPPIRRYVALPVSGTPEAPRAPPRPFVPCPVRAPVIPPIDPVLTDAPTIRAWAGQRGIISNKLDLDIVNAKRFALGLAPFALESNLPRRRAA